MTDWVFDRMPIFQVELIWEVTFLLVGLGLVALLGDDYKYDRYVQT